MHVGAHRKRVLDPLELELKAVVRHPMCVLGTEPRSFARSMSIFDVDPSLQRLFETFNTSIHLLSI